MEQQRRRQPKWTDLNVWPCICVLGKWVLVWFYVELMLKFVFGFAIVGWVKQCFRTCTVRIHVNTLEVQAKVRKKRQNKLNWRKTTKKTNKQTYDSLRMVNFYIFEWTPRVPSESGKNVQIVSIFSRTPHYDRHWKLLQAKCMLNW